MRICMILEGCYPYVTGGVSTWMHQYIQACPGQEFVLWVIAAYAKDRGKFKYELPDNVVEVHEVFLDQALKIKGSRLAGIKFTQEELAALAALISGREPDWDLLFDMYQTRKIDPMAALVSEDFLQVIMKLCEEKYPYIAFADMFHTVRSMLLPVLYVMGQKAPKADVYHAVATGYGGLLAALGSFVYKKPCLLTEHGIYTREREEEIIRAKWVTPSFKSHWIRFFYTLSALIYDRATCVTSLFENAKKIQIELGCKPEKCSVVSNGIHFRRFAQIPLKPEDGWIDIGAVVRLAPIKDIKTLIMAFYELKTRGVQARLYILGGTDDEVYERECLDMIQQLEVSDIILTGQVNVIEYLAKFDFTVLSSISEGQPLSVIESMAAGRPCVTTDVGCLRELLLGTKTDDLGRAGYLCPPMSREGLADAMEQMCSDRQARLKMGEVARERARIYYQHEDMIRKYQVVIGEVNRKWQESALN